MQSQPVSEVNWYMITSTYPGYELTIVNWPIGLHSSPEIKTVLDQANQAQIVTYIDMLHKLYPNLEKSSLQNTWPPRE